jgi:nicotinate-nucleotide adenylyltransferase
MSERVGLFGGTFDPIHVAHLAVATAARHQLGLDRVLLMVANVPWQKAQERHVSPVEARFAMTAAAVAGRTGLEASRMEIDRGGDSYTADTLAVLQAPGREVFLIIGSDLVDDLTTWKRWEELPPLCTLAIAHRPGEDERAELAPGWRIRRLEIPALHLSSTELRTMAEMGRPLDFLVPDEVIAVAVEHGLYGGGIVSEETKTTSPAETTEPAAKATKAAKKAATKAMAPTVGGPGLTSSQTPLQIAREEVIELARVAAVAADDKKADRTVILDVGDIVSITECLIITSAPNTRLVVTIADEVEAQVRAAGGGSPIAVEGIEDGNWVLLDYGGFVVHVFLTETRDYYELERLWGEAPRISWTPRPPADVRGAQINVIDSSS